MLGLAAGGDQAGFAQHAELLGKGGLVDIQAGFQFADRVLAFGEGAGQQQANRMAASGGTIWRMKSSAVFGSCAMRSYIV